MTLHYYFNIAINAITAAMLLACAYRLRRKFGQNAAVLWGGIGATGFGHVLGAIMMVMDVHIPEYWLVVQVIESGGLILGGVYLITYETKRQFWMAAPKAGNEGGEKAPKARNRKK